MNWEDRIESLNVAFREVRREKPVNAMHHPRIGDDMVCILQILDDMGTLPEHDDNKIIELAIGFEDYVSNNEVVFGTDNPWPIAVKEYVRENL